MDKKNKRALTKTDWFRVAVSGKTVDQREIYTHEIDEMASTYSQTTYGARINLDHIRGYSIDSQWKMYGDVIAAKAEDAVINGVKCRALYVKLEVTDDLIEINRKSQKIFSSIEMTKNFAGTGKAYLLGLAFTDNPASLGTEMLKFSTNFNIETFTTDAIESSLSFEQVAPEAETEEAPVDQNFFTSLVKNLFKKEKAFNREDLEQAFTTIAEEFTKHDAKRTAEFAALEAKHEALEQKQTALDTKLESYSTTPAADSFRAPNISGNESDVEEAKF